MTVDDLERRLDELEGEETDDLPALTLADLLSNPHEMKSSERDGVVWIRGEAYRSEPIEEALLDRLEEFGP